MANLNGFQTATDCQGNALANNGVVVNFPPTTGPHTGDNNYVEVITTRKMTTTFSGALGMSCWMVSGRAVSTIGTNSVAKCSFCSLNSSNKNHTLVLKNGATLRVDGDIIVNSTNGGSSGGCTLNKWNVCGDGFDVFGAGGSITARTISVSGGWETHDLNPTKADALGKLSNGSPCPQHPDPPSQTAPWLPSNVCIHMPQIADPLNDSATPKNQIAIPPVVGAPVAGVNGCPAGASVPTGTSGSPVLKTITTAAIICPGTYHGGLAITSSASVTMMPGVYYMAGGGFTVANAASVNGTAGVMIYNASGTAVVEDINPGTDLVPAKDKSKKDTKNVQLTSSTGTTALINENFNLTFVVGQKDKTSPIPTGLMTFFSGDTPITGCANMPVVAGSVAGTVQAVCPYVFTTFGTKSLASVYYGDAVYNASGDTLVMTVTPPAGALIAPITINTTGNVKLYGPLSGPYKGLTMFQQRSSTLTITLNPGSGAAACTGSWLTQDVPDVAGVDPPPACGALGGIRGTIYAADDDALVYITASGLANLQIISGKIQIDSNADARFAYTPEFFANGSIRLVE